MTCPDAGRTLVGCWTFTDPNRPLNTPSYRLTGSVADRLEGDAAAVYYGAVEPGGRTLLLLHNDLHRSTMSRQRFDDDGTLIELGRWSSGGDGGSYIAFDRTGAYFAVANARTGWAVFRNGDTPEIVALLSHVGSGPHPRQARSHPHCALFSPDNRWLYAVDMGSDAVLAFPFDAATGELGAEKVAYRASPGSGPRHLLFHRGHGYVLNELNNTLIVLRPEEDGTFTERQQLKTLPDEFDGFSHTAHLAVDAGRGMLLASNRGHDTIVRFKLDPDGLAGSPTWSPSGGAWPWHFLVADDGGLLVANALSDRVCQLLPNEDGAYSVAGEAVVPHPVFLLRR